MEESNKNKSNQITPKNLSDQELQKRLDLYSNGDERQYFDIQKIKRRYIANDSEKQSKRTQADLFYAKGMRSGLPHSSYEKIKSDRENQDQDSRDSVIEEAKSVYRKHQTLSKNFDKKVAPTYSPDQLKQLSKYFKKYAPHSSPNQSMTKEHHKQPQKGRNR